MTYDFRLSCTLPASPEAVYDAWLDSACHSAMTGAPATIGQRVGETYSPLGTATSSARRSSSFPGDGSSSPGAPPNSATTDPDSTVAVELEPTRAGTRLTLSHSGVPDDQTDYENGGWRDFYFSPMKAYFAREKEGEAGRRRAHEPCAPSSAPGSDQAELRAP